MLGLAIGAFLLVTGIGLVVWMRDKSELRPLLPAAVATVLGLGVAVGFYLWVFQVGAACSGRGDFGCQINANQGLLTLLGLVLALGGVWTTILTRFFDQRASQKALRDRVDAAILAAMEETRHNLIHVALAYDEDRKLAGLPLMKIDQTVQLLQEPIRHEIDDGVLHGADKIQIQFSALQRLAAKEATDKASEDGALEPFCVESLVIQSLGLLYWAGMTTQVGHDFLHQPGLQDLHEAVLEDKQPFFILRTSDEELVSEVPTLRSEGNSVVCWWNDDPPERLKVWEQGPRFSDLAIGHTH